MIVVAATLGLLPVTNPGVQDCGAPAAYLLHGRVDTYPDSTGRLQRSDGTIDRLTKAELSRAFHHRCSTRVARRMVPAGVGLAAGVVLGVLLLLASLVTWWRAAPQVRRAA